MDELFDEMRASVRRGMALLDEKIPDWESKLRLHMLRMEDCSLCVLGQVLGNYFNIEARRSLGIPSMSAALRHGFNLEIPWTSGLSTMDAFNHLGRIWKEEIFARNHPTTPEGGQA